MKKILSTLLVIAFALVGLNANAQQKVVPNSVHRYVVDIKDPASVSNKYVWSVVKKDGTSVHEGTDFKFVTSYTDESTPATGVPYAGNDGSKFTDFSVAKEVPVIFIKWIKPGDYIVQSMTFDATTGCYVVDFNIAEFKDINVDDSNNNFTARLSWHQNASDVADDADADCATSERDGTGTTTSLFKVTVKGHRAPKDLATTDLNKLSECTWTYKYEYIYTEEAIEASVDWTSCVHGTKSVDFNLIEYNDAATLKTNSDDILVTGVIPQGTGKYYVWIRLTEVKDGYGNAPKPHGTTADDSILILKATFNKIPAKQTIISD